MNLYFGLTRISLNCLIAFMQAVPTSKGQALADEYGMKFFETVSEKSQLVLYHSFIESL